MIKNTRVEAVDALRGFAVMGILLIHCVENYNLFNFTPIDNEWLKFIDSAVFDSTFFVFAGKAYGIFALLFGFSFFIQDNNHLKKGNDFRLRFLWRLVLLFGWGFINSIIYTGDVLMLFSIIGITLLFVSRLSTKVILIIATVLILQPLEWAKVFYAVFNPHYIPAESIVGYHFGQLTPALVNHTNPIELLKIMVKHSELASITWAWEHGRFFQTSAFFMFGMLIGRKGFFLYTPDNVNKWWRYLVISILCFFPLSGLVSMLPKFIENEAILSPLDTIISSFANAAFMSFIVLLIIIVFYTTTKGNKILRVFIPYGKMSLSNYLSQSLIGAFIFYSWGLGLSTSVTISFFIGIGIFILQCAFSHWWMKRYRHGPLEYLWKKAMWIGRW